MMKKNSSRAAGQLKQGASWLNLFLLLSLIGIFTLGFTYAFSSSLPSQPEAAAQTDAAKSQPPVAGSEEEKAKSEGANPAANFFARLFENKDLSADLSKPGAWRILLTRVPLRFLLAALLAAMLAYRPHKFMFALQRNPYVAQTQILLAVVASALMMIVADNAARAFGIFAAASLVRFRTDIRDPKEVAVMLISLAVGLATGVGHVALAVIFTMMVLFLLWALEYHEPTQIYRSLELKIKTSDIDKTHERLREVFDRHQVTAEVRALNRRHDNDPAGKLVYLVNAHANLGTDKLSDDFLLADRANIASIEWQQKKSISYFYR